VLQADRRRSAGQSLPEKQGSQLLQHLLVYCLESDFRGIVLMLVSRSVNEARVRCPVQTTGENLTHWHGLDCICFLDKQTPRLGSKQTPGIILPDSPPSSGKIETKTKSQGPRARGAPVLPTDATEACKRRTQPGPNLLQPAQASTRSG
jgi:hypothetical protein